MSHKSKQLSYSQYASKQKRFFNFLIDLIISQLFAYILAILAITILTFWGFFDNFEQDVFFVVEKLSELLIFVFTPIYFIFFESIFGKTIAKYLTKTEVVDIYGEKPSFWKIVIRSYSRLLPYEMFTFLSQKKLGWHDKVSNTRVIDARDFKM